MHRFRKSFPFFLMFYEMLASIRHIETTEKMPTTMTETTTTKPKISTSNSVEVQLNYSHPHFNNNNKNLSNIRHDHSANQRPEKVKIELGATSIIDHGHNPTNNIIAPKFTMPEARHGPFFEDGNVGPNVTVRVGANLELDCKVGLLGDRTVTWHRVRNQSFDLLSLGRFTHHKDERINLAFRYPNNYRLQITYVTKRDDGLYECQITTHPVIVRKTYVKIVAPMVRIMDESGREVSERYYRVGSSLLLTCSATNIGLSDNDEPGKNILGWTHGDLLLHKYSLLNLSKNQDSAISTLKLVPLDRKHSGNYSCSVGGQAEAFVTVHVLYGELPAAVQTAGVRPSATVSTRVLLVILSCLSVLKR